MLIESNNPIHSKLEVLSYTPIPYFGRPSIITSGTTVADVHYKYDGVGYKAKVPLKKSGELTYLDFTQHRHNNLGYVPVKELEEEES